MILSNDGFNAFHYRSYGTFFLHKIGSIISIGDLPTTNIIEPKKLTSGEDNRCPLYFYIQSDENSFLKVVKVPKTKSISFDEFNEIIGCFQFGVGIGQLKGVDNFLFVLEEGFEDSLKKRMNLFKIVLNESEKFVSFFILEVKKQELIEIIVVFQVF